MPEYRFDRYRNGRKMAEGLVLTKLATVEQATEAAYLLADPGDMFVLREDLARLAAVEAERDAAQAGEARAVEALKRCHEGAARQLAEPRDHDDDQYALAAIATDCEAVLAAQGPALDWLAQQRREAAAEALENVRIGWLSDNDYRPGVPEIWRYIANRAAALRTGEVGDE